MGKQYRESLLAEVNRFYNRVRPNTGLCGVKRFHDNASVHKCIHVQEYLADENTKTLPRPAYFPDFVPCNFSLFPDLRKCLTERRFNSRSFFGSAIFQCLSHNTQNRVQAGISEVGRNTLKVCCRRWKNSLQSCSSRKSFAVKRTHFLHHVSNTRMKHLHDAKLRV